MKNQTNLTRILQRSGLIFCIDMQHRGKYMNDVILYYFSGIGNSFVTTQEIGTKLDAEIVEITCAMKKEQFKIKVKVVGFVFPCHGFTTPSPVQRFIDKIDLDSAKYVFAVVTSVGTSFRGFDSINKSLKKQKRILDSSFVIDMPSNDPKFKDYKTPTYEVVEKCHEEMEKKIDLIANCVNDYAEYYDSTAGVRIAKGLLINRVLEKAIAYSVHNIAPKAKNYFYTTDDCIGCGTCQKICSAGKMRCMTASLYGTIPKTAICATPASIFVLLSPCRLIQNSI